MTNAALIAFPDKETMTSRLVELISLQLATALAEKPRALFAVSGGSSPKPLYERLSASALDWDRVDVLLVDERWVNPGEAGSNETFIQESLLQNHAAAASLIGLKTNHADPYEGRQAVEEKLQSVSDQIDVAVMGMGPDAHTASWFPQAKHLDTAFDQRSGNRVAAITAQQSEVTGAFVDRITLTLPYVARAALCVLMISGEAKRTAYEEAMQAVSIENYPVRALAEYCSPFWPCWAP